ncbi:unnamed protein product [Thlaspi arvense]|uniref:Uncharacterized protein n=1 Tax=Thlaspi arvense TaxID=13288 RepID=A0AAU9T4C7_THLAR|nr:unnamed protein product [Thlaspi arvense]
MSNAKLWAANFIQFKNSLGPQNKIYISCGGNVAFNFFLNPREIYNFSFHGYTFKKNVIDCVITQTIAKDKMAKIRAYSGGSALFEHGKKNYWDFREDGIYFTHGKAIPKLDYKWSTPPKKKL